MLKFGKESRLIQSQRSRQLLAYFVTSLLGIHKKIFPAKLMMISIAKHLPFIDYSYLHNRNYQNLEKLQKSVIDSRKIRIMCLQSLRKLCTSYCSAKSSAKLILKWSTNHITIPIFSWYWIRFPGVGNLFKDRTYLTVFNLSCKGLICI